MLDRPEIPLHTNGSENDIRAQVTRRKVSGGTRSDIGRDCRDVFSRLIKTCQKLECQFWDYLGRGSPSQSSPPSHTYPNSSKVAAGQPNRHGFCQHCCGRFKPLSHLENFQLLLTISAVHVVEDHNDSLTPITAEVARWRSREFNGVLSPSLNFRFHLLIEGVPVIGASAW